MPFYQAFLKCSNCGIHTIRIAYTHDVDKHEFVLDGDSTIYIVMYTCCRCGAYITTMMQKMN